MNKLDQRISFEKYAATLINVTLQRATYDLKQRPNVSFKVEVFDDIKVEGISNDDITYRYKREVNLVPDQYLKIVVEFVAIFVFDLPSKEFFGGDLVKIEAFAEKQKIAIVQSHNIIARASNIISTLTNNDNLNPLITNPMFEK